METSKERDIPKTFFTGLYIFLIVTLTCFTLWAVFLLRLWAFKYPYSESWDWIPKFSVVFLIPILMMVIGLIVERKRTRGEEKNAFRRNYLIFLAVVLCIYLFILWGTAFLFGFFDSQTEDPNNYLKVDKQISDAISHKMFPDEIPKSASNIRYFYRWKLDYFQNSYDIMAEWQLPEAEYEAEKERIFREFPEGMTVVSEYLPKFIDYRLRYQNDSSFFKYEFVSFSDEYRTVRYTVADYIYGGSFYDPYFLESDEW